MDHLGSSNVKAVESEFEKSESDVGSCGSKDHKTYAVDDSSCHGKGKGSYSHTRESLRVLTDTEVLEMRFLSEDEAHSFYKAYAKATGFGIRKSRSKPLKGNNLLVRCRKWVCSREGVRHNKHKDPAVKRRRPKAETRVGCHAGFRVRYDRAIGQYVVTHFVKEHNHELAKAHCVPFLRAHRDVTSADKAQASAMRKVGMRTSDIMDFMVHQSGGYSNVGFTAKDLHNEFIADRQAEIENGDAEGALGYLSAKLSEEPLFFLKYSVDKDNRLETLFWTDGRSRADYASFGDVLVFDTTYRTNAYKKPFVILAGVSNHFRTTIFGCALLSNETEESYVWVLNALMEAMNGRRPKSVVTDGDHAMSKAIKQVFPEAVHRICTWHLEQNAGKNIHIPNFVTDFTKLMQKQCTIERFENEWVDMVAKYGLETNNWIAEMYHKRRRWAEAYLIGIFFAGMKSTQRCEGMNGYLNRFLTVKLRLYEFVEQYDRGIARMRVNDAEAESATENSTPVLTTQLRSLEKHGAEVYTQYIFKLFQDEIVLQYPLFVSQRVDEGGQRVYHIGKYELPKSAWRVEYSPADSSLKCCCLLFESIGIPCCHMIAVMKSEQLSAIPPSCVMRRWTKLGTPQGEHPTVGKISKSLTQIARYGILSSGYNLVSFYASHGQEEFEEAREVQHQMMSILKDRWETRMKSNKEGGEGDTKPKLFGVQDPVVVTTKGNPGRGSCSEKAPKRRRRCGYCNAIGHNRRTCRKLVNRSNRVEGSEEEFDTSMQDESTSNRGEGSDEEIDTTMHDESTSTNGI